MRVFSCPEFQPISLYCSCLGFQPMIIATRFLVFDRKWFALRIYTFLYIKTIILYVLSRYVLENENKCGLCFNLCHWVSNGY